MLALGGALAAAALAAAPSEAAAPVKRTVKVGDYFLSPSRLTVPRASTITWKWLAGNADTHDVKLVHRPNGAPRFHSAAAETGYQFTRKLRVRGRYTVVCTFHPQIMRQTIVVK
jgi:plastocyanin